MRVMKYKNGDLGMWHKFAEFAEQLKFLAETEEMHLYQKCKFYSWDDNAFEENCNYEKLEGKHKGFGTKKGHGGDFDSKLECYKCPYYSVGGKEKQKMLKTGTS